MSREVAKKFIDRISSTVDPLANIVTVSLFCENAINHLIREKLPKVRSFKDPGNLYPDGKLQLQYESLFCLCIRFNRTEIIRKLMVAELLAQQSRT